MQRTAWGMARLTAACAVMALSACEDPVPEPNHRAWAGDGVCVPDDALRAAIASGQPSGAFSPVCVADDNCPCDMHCALGLCESACRYDDECAAGTVCDAFGRCVAQSLANLPETLPGTARGSLLADRTQLEVSSPESRAKLGLFATILEVPRARLVAETGLEVSCDGTNFAAQCFIENVRPGEVPRQVLVRATGDWPQEDERRALTVNAPGQRLQVGVVVKGAVPPDAPVRHGRYEGTARLVSAGLLARSPDDKPLPDELARLELRVTAHVFPESGGVYTVAFDDARRTVFAAGAVGQLAYDAVTGWGLTMPARQYLGDDEDMPTGLDVHVTGTVKGGRFTGGLLQGELVQRFDGITTDALAPFARWRVSLHRVGELPAGLMAPSLTPRLPADAATRAGEPFPEEAAAEAALPGLAAETGTARAVATLCSDAALVTTLSDSVYGHGDLRCTNSATQQRAFGVETGLLSGRGVWLDSCSEALDLDTPQAWGSAALAGVCAVRPRAVTAIAAALHTDRQRAFQTGVAADAAATRLSQRLLQQWLGVQTLVALEPRRLARVGPLLPSGPALDRIRHYAGQTEVLGAIHRSIAGWDFVLHPRVASALTAMTGQGLVSPDYRPDFAAGTYPDGEMKQALPVSMLQTLTRQVEALDGLVDDFNSFRYLGQQRQAVTAELSNFLPRNLVLFALANGLHDAALSVQTLPWEPRWEIARQQYGSAVGKLVERIALMESGRNPLGIDDQDLPLYRLGDQQGTTRRFSALSDSLLGREDLLDPAIAPTLLDRVVDAEARARSSVSALLDRELQANLQEAATAERLDNLKRLYGDQITSYCASYDSLTVLDLYADEIDPDTCFVAEHCRFDEGDYLARLSTGDLGYQICLAAKMRERFGDAVSTGQTALDRQLQALGPEFTAETDFFSLDTFSAIASGFTAGYNGVSPPSINIPSGVDQSAVNAIERLCDSARVVTQGSRPTENPTSCAKTDDCALGQVCNLASTTCVPEAGDPDPTCFIGSLGEAAVAIQGAATDVEIARSELEELTANYDNAMRGCLIMQQGNQAVEAAMSEHFKTMKDLRDAKFAADTAAKVAEKAAGLFELDKPWKAIGAAIFGAVQQAAESTAGTIELRMEAAEDQHELTVKKLEGETEVRLCVNEAESHLVSARSAALRVKRATQELSAQFVAFQNLKISAAAAVSDGLISLEAERQRAVSPPNVDHWLDENIDLFEQRLRRAKRALYLAVLAVEYEFQFTSNERAVVLAARTATELEGPLGRLRDFVRRGAPPGGGNPTQLLSVLSLRRNLMQVAGREAAPAGMHRSGEVERFRRVLLSPGHAVYDAAGRYLGQEIPFTLQPLGRLGLADSGGVPLFSGLSCAERLWSVNVSVLGQNLMSGTDTTFTTLQLRKRNTFMSQWCGSADEGDQVATTRPSKNLFLDPSSASTWAQDDVVVGLTQAQEVTAFSPATVQARMNVSRPEFERVSYTDGQSTSLAGRGVFGDYALFIPATSQSFGGGAGLRLDRVDDILIRLEYVASERY